MEEAKGLSGKIRVAIIPARGGSKRIPRKNLTVIDGYPFLIHAIQLARKCGLFDAILVSTDDEEISELSRKHGAEVLRKRSKQASSDVATTYDVIEEELQTGLYRGEVIGTCVCIYPTAVLACASDIANAISDIEDKHAECVMPIMEYEHPIERAFRIEVGTGLLEQIRGSGGEKRTQDLEKTYHDAGQWYAFDLKRLIACGSFSGLKTRGVVIPLLRGQDIDTYDHLHMATLKYNYLKSMQVAHILEKPWVLFRVDAHESVGSGHLMRCIALAEEFNDQGYISVFAGNKLPDKFRYLLDDCAILHKEICSESVDAMTEQQDAAKTLELIDCFSESPSGIVVDNYKLGASWRRTIKSTGIPVVLIDDGVDDHSWCEVVVDQAMSMLSGDSGEFVMDRTEGGKCTVLKGGQYALLRKEFRYAHQRLEERTQPWVESRYVIYFGGADLDSLTSKVANVLLSLVEAEKIHVVIGIINGKADQIIDWCNSKGICVSTGGDSMASILSECSIYIGACGMAALEAEALGISSILIPASSIQQKVAEWLERKKRAVVLKSTKCLSRQELGLAIKEAESLPKQRSEDRIFRIDGATEVVRHILEIPHGRIA